MIPKRLLALTLFTALSAMPPCVLRAQWMQTNGPYGGDINSFAEIGTDLFAAVSFDGVFRSTDSGTSWTSVGLVNDNVIALCVSGKNLIAGTQNGNTYLSKNNGANWTTVGDLTDGGPWNVTSLAASDSNVFAATTDGPQESQLYSSTDFGVSWTRITPYFPILSAVNYISVIGSNLFAFLTYSNTSSKPIYYTNLFRYDGSGWEETGLPGNLDSVGYPIIGSGAYRFAESSGFFISTDSGNTWIMSDTSLQIIGVSVITGDGTNLYVGCQTRGVFASTDMGASWTSDNMGLNSTNINALAVIGRNIFAGTESGVYRSTDSATTWKQKSTGLPYSSLNESISAFAASGSNIFAGMYDGGGVFRSSDNGMTWVPGGPGLPQTNVRALAILDTCLFAGGMSGDYDTRGGIFRSTDNGSSWSDLTGGLASPDSDVRALGVMGKDIFLATAGRGVFRSIDNGTSWQAADSGLQYYEVTHFEANASNLFATTGGGVYLSTDSGLSWTLEGSIDDGSIEALAAIGSNLFVGTYGVGAIYRSTDNGKSWAKVDSGSSSFEVYSLAVFGTNLFAGTSAGAFRSTDMGASWQSIDDGLGVFSNSWVSLALNDEFLFAVTDPVTVCQVWRRPLSDFGISSVSQTPVAAAPEIQIYPNPFSQSTQISFTSQAAGYAEVSIVNMLGVEVARLLSGELDAGEHNISWEPADGTSALRVPDGMYECLVRMNGQVETLPVLVLH